MAVGSTLLVPIFIVWAVTCAAVGAALLRRAPAVSLALFGSVLGAIGGFLVGNADGPAEVPAYTAVGASVGLFVNGGFGMLATSARPPSEPLRRAAWVSGAPGARAARRAGRFSPTSHPVAASRLNTSPTV